MKNYILKSLAPFWLGMALSEFAHIDIMMWEFYAIVIPFFVFDRLRNYDNNKKNITQ